MKIKDLRKDCIYKLTENSIRFFKKKQGGLFFFVDARSCSHYDLEAEVLRFKYIEPIGTKLVFYVYETTDMFRTTYVIHAMKDILNMIEVSEELKKSVSLVKDDFNHVCRKCGSRAYAGLNDIECPNCGRY